MSRFDDLKRLKDAAADQLKSGELKETLSKAAGDAIVGTSSALEGAETVAQRSGLTNKKGEVSKIKVAKTLLHPTKSARTILGATAAEIEDRRAAPPEQ